MKNYKKVLAATLALTMVVGSSALAAPGDKSYVSDNDFEATTSSNAQGTITGGGQMEGHVSEDVFKVIVPECITPGYTGTFDRFNFVLDPQKLITQTEAVRYKASGSNVADRFVGDKTLYFVNKTDRQMDDTSDYIKVTNKSSMPVDITLGASITGITAIKLSDTKTFADDSTSMYMAIIGNDGNETAIKADGSTVVEGTIPKADIRAYDTVYDSGNNSYEYELVDDKAEYFSTYEFALTGATNGEGDWLNINENPSLTVTWKIEPAAPATDVAPSAQLANKKPATGDLTIPIDLGKGTLAATGITKITFTNNAGVTKDMLKDADYTFDGTKLTFKASHLVGVTAEREYIIKFNDTAGTNVTIKVAP